MPVTGQDASDEGLQRVIAGTQCGTVFKDVNLEAKAAADVAIAILKDDGSADALVNGAVDDSESNRKVNSVFATPVWITQENIKEPFDAGYTTVDKVCTGDVRGGLHQARSELAGDRGPGRREDPGRAPARHLRRP